MVVFGLLACLMFGFGLLSRRLEGTVVSAAMVFVAAGLVAGWTGLVDLGATTHVDPSTSREAMFLVVEEEPALTGIDEIFLVMTVTVLSVLAHGISAAPLTRRYARLTDTLESDNAQHRLPVAAS